MDLKQETSDGGTDPNQQVVDVSCRRSHRRKVLKRCYSPERAPKREYKRQKPSFMRQRPAVRICDRLSDGTPFCCEFCKSPYVCKSNRRCPTKRSRHQPYPRIKTDPDTGQKLTLCNACGLAFERPSKRKKQTNEAPSSETKEKYIEEARQNALSLAEVLNDPDAERLFCPEYKKRPCACLQKYIIGDGNADESRNRAEMLLQLMKEAKRLSTQKVYNMEELLHTKPKKRRSIGLGNGQKHSKQFGDYILSTRRVLRDEYKLCERGCQRVLIYSNNFLHKRLKTEDFNCRVEQVRSKFVKDRLKPISGMHNENCCPARCTLTELTHGNLLEGWRERSTYGQAETRRVLAEMLTPSGGMRGNCYTFIQWITGAGYATIASVEKYMRETGGDREPPEHGLKRYHRNQQRLQHQKEMQEQRGRQLAREARKELYGDHEEQQGHQREKPVEVVGRESRERHVSHLQRAPGDIQKRGNITEFMEQPEHNLPASVSQPMTVLSATESVVVEQLNTIPHEHGAQLVVENSSANRHQHLAEESTTSPIRQILRQHTVTSHDDWDRSIQVQPSSASQLIELPDKHQVQPCKETDSSPQSWHASRFQTVTRLLGTQPPSESETFEEVGSPALHIDLNHDSTSRKTPRDGASNETDPPNLKVTQYYTGNTQKSERLVTRRGDDHTFPPESSSSRVHKRSRPDAVITGANQEAVPRRTATPDLKAELEGQRQQIMLLQKQVAEQQLQLHQQQQLLQTQVIGNLLLNRPKPQSTPNLQVPGLPVGLSTTVPQVPCVISEIAAADTQCTSGVPTVTSSVSNDDVASLNKTSQSHPVSKSLTSNETLDSETNHNITEIDVASTTTTHTLVTGHQSTPLVLPLNLNSGSTFLPGVNLPIVSAPQNSQAQPVIIWTTQPNLQNTESRDVINKNEPGMLTQQLYPTGNQRKPVEPEATIQAKPAALSTSPPQQAVARQMLKTQAATTPGGASISTDSNKRLIQPLTAAQRQILHELLPCQEKFARQRTQREPPIKPPPPYEIAASSSRQGSVERSTPETCPSVPDESTHSPVNTTEQGAKNKAVCTYATGAETKTSNPVGQRRGRKPKQRPIKSPPKAVRGSASSTPVKMTSPRLLMHQSTEGATSTAPSTRHQVSDPVQQIHGTTPELVQKLLEISQAAGDGHVTTLTLTHEQAHDIIGQLNKYTGNDPVLSNLSFIQEDVPDAGAAEDKAAKANKTSSAAEVLLNQMYVGQTDDDITSKPLATANITIAADTGSVVGVSEPLGKVASESNSVETATRGSSDKPASPSSYLFPDILQLLTQTNSSVNNN